MAWDEKERAAQTPQNISLTQRNKLTVTGVEEVLSFDESRIELRTVLGELSVGGSGLRVGRLSVDAGELSVEGRVDSLSYSEHESLGGFWSRLFG